MKRLKLAASQDISRTYVLLIVYPSKARKGCQTGHWVEKELLAKNPDTCTYNTWLVEKWDKNRKVQGRQR